MGTTLFTREQLYFRSTTTQTTPGSNSVFPLGDHTQIDIPVPGDHQYTFQVQSCSVGTVVFWVFAARGHPLCKWRQQLTRTVRMDMFGAWLPRLTMCV